MTPALRFPVFVAVSLLAFLAILAFVTRKRAARPSLAALLGVAVVVVVGGMVFAKVGRQNEVPPQVYWASNLGLWFPWSYSAVLGMTLMLTVAPVLWGYAVLLCLRTYPGEALAGGAARVAIILLVLAVVMDYVFFGLIRDALRQLYHPTTLYGYGFLAALPFIVGWMLRARIERSRRAVTKTDLLAAGAAGHVCLAALTSIILLGIEL